jgi:hypothetical protein
MTPLLPHFRAIWGVYQTGAGSRFIPDLVTAVAELDVPSLVLDGEIAIFDGQLISRFEWLRARPKQEVATPPMYMVFDLLELEGEDLRPRPLRERREALQQLVAGRELIIPTRRLPDHGLEAWDEVLRGNYEGPRAPTRDPAHHREPAIGAYPRPARREHGRATRRMGDLEI